MIELHGIPVLQTPRLILRGPDPKDWAGYRSFITSPRAIHVGGPLDAWEAWRSFSARWGHWAIRGFGMWSVTERGSDDCIGIVGCNRPERYSENELGWNIWAGSEGRGLAYEAALAVRDHAFRSLGWDTAVSYIAPANSRSIALATRLGATPDPDAASPFADEPVLVYRHPKPEGRAC